MRSLSSKHAVVEYVGLDGPRAVEAFIEDRLRRDDLMVVHVDVTQNPFVGGYTILLISHSTRHLA